MTTERLKQLTLLPSLEAPTPASEPPVIYYPDFLNQGEAELVLSHCKSLKWQHNQIRMFGEWIDLPRLEVMLGDSEDYRYLYSGSVELRAKPWTPLLHYIRHRIEKVTGYKYQLVIGNYYRSGNDHIGWHSDDEKSMGECPAIASLSLGVTRRFQLKPKKSNEAPTSFELGHGSLLLMLPGCQEGWVHRLCKKDKLVGERINLTFRPYVEPTE